MISVADEATNLYSGFLNYRFVEDPILTTDAYTREGMAEVFALIGGFIGMMKNFAYLLLGSY